MAKGIKIEKNIAKKSELLKFDKPKFVYIPLLSINDTEPTVLAKKKDKVLIGTPIAKTKGDVKMAIVSTVSGEVVDYVAMTYKNKKIKCIKIKNDFREKKEEVTASSKMTKKSFIKLLQDNNIIGLESNVLVYQKYAKNAKTLVINAVESEPLLFSDQDLLANHAEEILECIDNLLDINEINNAIIVIKENNYRLMEVLNDYIGTYLRMKIVCVSNIYPIGYENKLVKEVLKLNDEVIVNNVYTIYDIYKAIKGDFLTQKIITFIDFEGNTRQNVLVKVGAQVTEVLKSIFNIDVENKIIISGGPMKGFQADEDLIVTKDLKSVIVMNHNKNRESACMRCGKCINVCPVGLFPLEIRKNINNINKLKKMHVEKCIECGLCAYICPAKSDMMRYIREAKEKIKESEI